MIPHLRLLLVILATLVLAPLAFLAWLVTGVRTRAATVAGMYAMHLWSHLVRRALGVRVTVRGSPPRGAAIFASNHLGYLDIFVLGAAYPSLFVSMAELAGWPMVGPLARMVGTIFIDRSRREDVGRVRAEMGRELARGLPITVFPESRPSPGETVARFHAALFETAIEQRVPCVPVTLGYECVGIDEPPSTAVCWWGDMEFGPHFKKLLTVPRIEATIVFGEPVSAMEDRKELANAVHRAVLGSLMPVRAIPAGGLGEPDPAA